MDALARSNRGAFAPMGPEVTITEHRGRPGVEDANKPRAHAPRPLGPLLLVPRLRG